MEGLPRIVIARWLGVPIFVDVTFALVPLLLFPWRLVPDAVNLGWNEVHALRLPGIWIIAVIGTFLSILLHEMAHTLMARRLGVRANAIQIGGFFGLAIMPITSALRRWMLPVLAAGPLANLAIALCIWMLLGMPEVSSRFHVRVGGALEPGASFKLLPFWIDGLVWLLQLNVAMAIFNLLPAFPLDGGRMARISLRKMLGEARAVNLIAICGFAVGAWSILGGIGLGATLITTGLMLAVYNIAIWRREIDAPDD